MRESHKSKRLSWASDVNLCQVRLFLSEESPSQVGLDFQDHLQAKTSWLSHPPATPGATEDVLPPGFEAALPPNHSQSMLSQIPTIKWKSPPRFSLEITWQVVAGEESNEAASQNQREMRVLEAIYPRPSAIPPNPSVLPSSDELPFDDAKTPSIPITAIEDEEAEPVASSSSSQNVSLGTESSAFLAAALSGLANNSNNDQGSTIDRELLLKFLSNPSLAEKLAIDYGTITNNNNNNNPPPISRPTMTMPPSGPHYPQPNGNHYPNSRPAQQYPPPPTPQGSIPAPGHKDFSYYKSLIQQHGGERQEPQPPPLPAQQQYSNNNRYNNNNNNNHHQEPGMNGLKGRGDSKPKVMRPCVYFNSSRGCRHGANCSYQHDPSYQHRPDVQTAKRTKFDREISS